MSISGNYTAIVQVSVKDEELKKQIIKVSSKIKPIDLKIKINDTEINNIKQQLNQLNNKTIKQKVEIDTKKAKESLNELNLNTKKIKPIKIKVQTDVNGTSTTEKLNETIKNTSKNTKSLAKDFLETTGKVAKFGASTAVIGMFYDAVNMAKEAVFEFDDALTEFRKVSSLNEKQLSSYTDKLGEMGREVARTRTEMLQASTEFVKTGASEEDAAKLSKVATLYQNIADTQLSAGDSAAYITSQMKAFNITADNSISIIDKTNEVSNRFAVSSSDISSALTKTSGAMATYGNTIDQTIGLTVAGTEILTGQAGKVSRGLRSVGAEIVKLANDTGTFSYKVDGATKTLSLFDKQGKMLSTFDVLSKIYQDWNKMNEAEQSSLALTLGMKTQIDVLGATLNNFDSALKAVDVSMNSQGSAIKENEAYMKSLQAKINLLKSEFQEFILGDGGLSNFIKLIIDAGTSILKFANSDLGKAITQISLMTTALILANKGLKALESTKLSNLIKEIILLKQGVTSVTTSTFALDVASKGLWKTLISLGRAWLTSPLGMTTIAVGGIYLLTTSLNKLNKTTKDLQEQASKSSEDYINQQKTVETLSSKIKELEEQIDKINKKDSLNVVDKEQLNLLEREKGILESQAYLEQIKLERKKEQAKIDSEKVLNSITSDLVPVFNQEGVYSGYGAAQLTQIQTLEAYSQAISNTTEELDVLIQKQKEQPEDSKEYRKSAKAIIQKKTELDDLIDKSQDYSDIISKEIPNLDKESELYNESTKALEDNADVIKGTIKEIEDKTKADNDNIYSTEELAETQQKHSENISNLSNQLKDITSAYQLTADAQYEYNQQGYLSVDTYSQLMNLKPEYLAMMFDENGQLYANADAVAILTKQKIQELGVEAALSQINLANKLANENSSYAALTQGIMNNTSALWSNVDAGIAELQTRLKRKEISQADFDAVVRNTNAIKQQTNQAIQNVSAITSSYQPTNRNTSAQRQNSGARKSNTDAIKSQTDALKKQKQALEAEADILEKQLKDYEIVVGYVKDLIKEEQEALEEAKDKELEAIQNKIDALEKEQDVFNENIDSQIEALEKQKDETEKYYDDQINAIQNENKALEENLKLKQLQEALARAKTQKVKVFKDGQFVYEQDEESISKAEQELADYEAQLAVQRQIEELERLKENALQSLDKQIQELEQHREEKNNNYEKELEDLKNHYNKTEAEYNKRIKQLDSYLKQFENMLNASAKRHAEILYKELVGEQKNWDDRMKALQKFVNNYDAKKKQLDNVKNQINAITNQIQGLESQARTIQGNINGIVTNANNQLNSLKGIYGQMDAMNQGRKWRWQITQNGKIIADGDGFEHRWQAQEKGDYYKKQLDPFGQAKPPYILTTHAYAKGSYGIPDDQIALVADPKNPQNRELVVGAKINQDDGILGKFKKGTGIIPSGNTLTENLVNLARWNQNGGLERIITNNSNSSSNIVNIENINLPNIQNGQDFVEYLQNNFMNDTIQFANTRI